MTEQLNEREKWLLEQMGVLCISPAGVRESAIGLIEKSLINDAPPDPNLARITELEADVARLNGLLDDLFWGLSEVDGFGDDDNAADRWELAAQVAYVNGREEPSEDDIREGLILCIRNARRTAERKEPTDASD